MHKRLLARCFLSEIICRGTCSHDEESIIESPDCGLVTARPGSSLFCWNTSSFVDPHICMYNIRLHLHCWFGEERTCILVVVMDCVSTAFRLWRFHECAAVKRGVYSLCGNTKIDLIESVRWIEPAKNSIAPCEYPHFRRRRSISLLVESLASSLSIP